MAQFKGKPPGSGAGDISRRTEALRPVIAMTPKQTTEARSLRRGGLEPTVIAERMGLPFDEVEKSLCQMRMPRPETTRGTLNVTLAAHAAVMRERHGEEPLWCTMDRLFDELFRLRQEAAAASPSPRKAGRRPADEYGPLLPDLFAAR